MGVCLYMYMHMYMYVYMCVCVCTCTRWAIKRRKKKDFITERCLSAFIFDVVVVAWKKETGTHVNVLSGSNGPTL